MMIITYLALKKFIIKFLIIKFEEKIKKLKNMHFVSSTVLPKTL